MYNWKLRVQIISALFSLILLSGCASLIGGVGEPKAPPVAPLDPIYALPTVSLAEKEEILFDAAVERHINDQGYLLYRSRLPFSDPENYQQSHNSADLPAWHGHWMAALAMKLAVAPSPETELLLRRAVKGLRTNFEATGITGLLARAYLKYEEDERLPWMITEDQRPTRFWQKGKRGFWFRNGVAKGHYSRAVLGLATVIGLENRGAITLDSETSRLVRQTAIDIAHYLIENSYRIVDVDGDVTEFGELNDWRYNGFSALQLLAMLRLGKAIGDEKSAKEYDRLVRSRAGSVAANTLGGLGDLYARVGREEFGHFSDDEVIYANAFVLYFSSDEADEEIRLDLEFALRKMWQFLRYSRKTYMTFIQALIVGVSDVELEEGLETLRMFPDDKRIISDLDMEDTERVQPIANQRINSHYWKTDYFRKATRTSASRRLRLEHSGQDYLSAYWMGRYFDLISEEAAAAPVTWENS